MADIDVRPARRYAHIAQLILQGIESAGIQPGEKILADREWAKRLQVSRPTIREAFLALELAGIIDVRHGDGAYLKRTTLDLAQHTLIANGEPRQLIEARLYIEPQCAKGAASSQDAQALQTATERLEEAAAIVHDERNVGEFVRLGLLFHVDLAAATGNPLLEGVVHHLVNLGTQPIWRLVNENAMRDTALRHRQIEEHRSILDHIRRATAESAASEMTTHLQALQEQIYFAQA